MNTHDIDIELPPLPEARIVSYQTDNTMRRMELRTYSDKDMKDYARAAIKPYQQHIAELEAQLEAIDHARRIDGGIMNTEQERAAFEAWANGRGELHLVNPAGRYSSAITQFAWEAYQAGRAALQSQDREDALRYRWLRLQRSITDHACVTWNIGHDWVQMNGAELDAAIDAIRALIPKKPPCET